MTREEKKSVDKILFLLESDPKTGHIGIAEQLVIITKRVDSIENRHKVIYRVGIVLGGCATFVLGKSWTVIKSWLL